MANFRVFSVAVSDDCPHNLRIAEQYLGEFGKLAQKNNAMIIPSNLSDVAGIVVAAAKIFSSMHTGQEPGPGAGRPVMEKK